jgi:hypothetical protein
MIIINSAHPFASLSGMITGILLVDLYFRRQENKYKYVKKKENNKENNNEKADFDKYLLSLEKQRTKSI